METRTTLLIRLRDPDSQAWTEFESNYRELVTSWCRRRGVQATEIEDVWQRVLVTMMRGIGSFEYDRNRGRFRNYLFRAVQSSIIKERRGGAWSSTSGAAGLEENDLSCESELYSAWEQEWMEHHLRRAHAELRLSFEPRSVAVFDRLRNGDGVRETARAFGLSEQAVYKIKQRVRTRMRELVSQQIAVEDGEAA